MEFAIQIMLARVAGSRCGIKIDMTIPTLLSHVHSFKLILLAMSSFVQMIAMNNNSRAVAGKPREAV